MRKIIVLIGFVLLWQMFWVSVSEAAPPASGGFWHTVRYGETLSSIGRRFGVSPHLICQTNGLYNCNLIWRGQRLWIPSKDNSCRDCCSSYHRVQRGQTLFGIARYYGVHLLSIARANDIQNLNRIYVGQRLCIP